jgi:hypothetical protein
MSIQHHNGYRIEMFAGPLGEGGPYWYGFARNPHRAFAGLPPRFVPPIFFFDTRGQNHFTEEAAMDFVKSEIDKAL